MNLALRALNRYGLGARIDEAAQIDDPRRWLLRQLSAENTEIKRRNKVPRGHEIGETIEKFLIARREGNQEERRKTRRAIQELTAKEARATLHQRMTSDAPFVERLVAFWSNHLCVSTIGGNPLLSAIVGHYERTVIRPHVLGQFSDMVLASARHPAMLLYLDNAQSIGPFSQVGQSRTRRDNINENYARELLELHTLGVDGGYKQEDVKQLALILTGWTVRGTNASTNRGMMPSFDFSVRTHEPGTKRVLKQRYDESGVREGERVIKRLCHHKSTARHIATKLVRHFVSDDVPQHALAKVARAFDRSEGNLKSVAKSLINLEQAWQPQHRKFRTPQEWQVASLRAIDVRSIPVGVLPALKKLRHTMWSPGSPKGYGDNLDDWADPNGLILRAEMARRLTRKLDVAGVPPTRLEECVDLDAKDPLRAMLADNEITQKERWALALASPAFQWR